jgi:Ca2+-binding RTX toxin-like protein
LEKLGEESVVTSVFNAGFGAVPTFINETLPTLFSLTHQTSIDNFLQTFDLDSAIPTAVGSTLIRLTDGFGRTISIEGAGFGPIISTTDLVAAFSSFRTAVEALDGTGTGSLSRVILTDGATELFRLTVTPTAWVAASGTDTLTINGSLPTSLAQVNTAYGELTDAFGELDPAFNPATSILAGFRINSVLATAGTTVPASMTYTGNQILVTSGDYSLQMNGVLPLTFAQFAKVAITLTQDGTNSGFMISQGVIRQTSTNTVLATINGPLDASQILNLSSSGDDSLTFQGLNPKFSDLDLGAGNDVFKAAFSTAQGLYESGVINGGSGSDTYDFSGSTMAISAGLYMTVPSVTAPVFLIVQVGSGQPSKIAAQDFENIIGSGLADNLNGNHIANYLAGGAGNDTLAGNVGNDTIVGGAGADLLMGGSDFDVLSYETTTTAMTVNMSGTWTITGSAERIGDVFMDFEGIRTGLGADSITGSITADWIESFAGNDTMIGGSGNDTMIGGTGKDLFTGGGGLDRFVFNALSDSPLAFAGRDVINTFAHGDKIDLSAIDARTNVAGDQAFTFIGAAVFSGVSGQLRFDMTNISATGVKAYTVYGDVNGDSVADLSLQIYTAPTTDRTGQPQTWNLANWDFVL